MRSGAEQLTSPQHQVKPAASSRRSVLVTDEEEQSPSPNGRRPWTAPENLERVLMNLPAQGAWNGQKGVLGTGEIRLDAGH